MGWRSTEKQEVRGEQLEHLSGGSDCACVRIEACVMVAARSASEARGSYCGYLGSSSWYLAVMLTPTVA